MIAIAIATAQPPQRPPQPIIIMIIALTGILFQPPLLLQLLRNFIVAFFTFDKCQDNGSNEAEGDNTPAVNADVAHGIAAVTVDDGILDVKDDHDAETENGDDFKSIEPPFANAKIGKFVSFFTQFFSVEEPAEQYDFEETGGGNTDVVDEIVNDIEDVETGTGDEEEADNERRYQYDGNCFFMACLEFILEAGNNSLEMDISEVTPAVSNAPKKQMPKSVLRPGKVLMAVGKVMNARPTPAPATSDTGTPCWNAM